MLLMLQRDPARRNLLSTDALSYSSSSIGANSEARATV
jgi:hypothetical protein